MSHDPQDRGRRYMSHLLQKRVSLGPGDLRVSVRELAALAGVEIAWRPWPRRWLTEHEHRLLNEAVAESGSVVSGEGGIPRSLRSHVSLKSTPSSARSRPKLLARLTWTAAIKLGGLAGFAAALITIWPTLFPAVEASRPFEGQLNFAIVPFRASSKAGQDQMAADALSQTFAASLRGALRRGDPEVVPDVRVIDGASAPTPTQEDEGHAAAVLAKRLGADAVIYGSVDDGPSTMVTPSVYVAPPKLLGASEFAGSYPLGDPIALPVSLASSAPAVGIVRQALTTRAAGLASFIDAVGYSSLERFPEAVRYLHAAARSPGWQSPRAQGLLDLFLGNATAKLSLDRRVRLARAEAFYRSALIEIPGFDRARLGLAEVTFQRAHGDCTRRGVHQSGLDRALAGFHSVLTATAHAPASERHVLQVKAHFGLGRVYLCQSQAALAPRWPAAERELLLVSSSYRDVLLRDDAAEAYGDLALVALPGPKQRDPRRAYQQALEDYSRALALTQDPTARAALYTNRAFVRSRLGDRAGANADKRSAAQLEPS
jgi:tetratricopeptide (TPR) repeat protein